MRPLALTFAAAAVALLAFPAAGSAHHVVPSATIDAQLGPVNKYGEHELTVNWNVSCGDPAAAVNIQVGRLIKPKNPKLAPAEIDTFDAEAVQGPGSGQLKVSPGSRFAPTIDVVCTSLGDDGSEHSASTTVTGREFYLPPLLMGYSFRRGGLCGYKPTKRNLRKFQVGQQHYIDPDVRYNSLALLNSPRSLKGIVVRVKGGGLNARLRGRTLSGYLAFVVPIPKRSGRAKVWVEFDGVPTNKLTIPVLRNRCR